MRWYRSFKIIIGFAVATMMAQLFHLDFPISAGIITILNLLDTKKASVSVSLKRWVAAVFGLIILYGLFESLGYEIPVLFMFVLVFTPLAFRFKIREGLIVNIVIASHLLVYAEVTMAHFLNEFMIVSLGVVIGLILSFHVPQKEQLIKNKMSEIDCLIKENLYGLSMSINNMCHIDESDFQLEILVEKIKEAKVIAQQQMENFYLKDYSFYFEYFQLRLQQTYRLMYMKERLDHCFMDQNQARILSEFTSKLAQVFDPLNDGQALLLELDDIKRRFKEMPLPETQAAFIEKAALYQYLNDLEEFVRMKIRYMSRNKSQLHS